MRFLLCVFLMFVCGVGTVGATPFTCGANATYFSSTQKVSDPEFLYSAKEDYDVLANMSFREAQDGSHQLTHGKIYECDPAAFKKSSYCDMYTLVVADAGWVWKGNAVSGQTLFFCDMRDENNNNHDSWLPFKLVDDFAGEKPYLRKVNVYNKSGVTCWVSEVRREVKCDGLASKSSSTVTETKKSCDGKAHGTSESGVNCPAGFTNASKCSRVCNDGTWNYTLTDCVAGFKPSGNKCVARTGEDCPSNEWPQYAAGGKYNSNGRCYATACNDKALLVVDSAGKNQGWCVAKTYCQTEKKMDAKCKLKVIGGTKTDKTCDCPQEEQATDKTKAAPENASQVSECGEKDISADDRKKLNIVKSKVDNSEEYVHKGPDGKAICKTFKCSNGFVAENDTCVVNPAVAGLSDCTDEQQKLITDESVKKRIVKSSIDGETEPYSVKQSDKPVCVVNVCKTGMIADAKAGKCVKDESANNNQNTGEQSQGDSDAAPQGQNPQSQSAENNTPVDGADCADKDLPAHAAAGQYVNGQCRITKCKDGYVLRSEKDSSGVEKPVCMSGEEESQKKIDELRDNAQKMKDKEQSTANKLLGAAGIGATGIGGMMLASGMAEQNADAEAETAMKAYLATFHCNYGGGKNIPGGTNDVELPGGNELIGLYTEYVALANDLKARKADLGMQPGIESEAILESATSGLYDDVAVGKTGGAYASLARALMDPEGEDAKLWAAQKEKSAQQVKTGAITAGVGAAGSLIGNLAINSGKNKQNKVDEILNKYEKLKKPLQDLETDMNAIPAKKCSEFTGTTGTGDAPNCTCKNNNEFFAIDNGGCMKCENDGAIVENNVCKCPTDKPAIKNNKCVAVEPNCKLTGLLSGSKCECIDGAEHVNDNICKCKSTHNQVGNECQLKATTPITSVVNTNLLGGGIKALTTADLNLPQTKTTIRISGDTAFESGSAKLTREAEKALNKFMSQVKAAGNDEKLSDTNFCIEIVGHTDRVPFKKSANKTNKQLSQERADAVKKALLDISTAPVDATNYKATGMGASECLKEVYDKDNEPQCRRVDITLTSGAKCTQ